MSRFKFVDFNVTFGFGRLLCHAWIWMTSVSRLDLDDFYVTFRLMDLEVTFSLLQARLTSMSRLDFNVTFKFD